MYEELKKVLFGNQKQGDAINTVVTNIIGDALVAMGANSNGSAQDWCANIVSYTNATLSGEMPMNETVFALIYGCEAVGAFYNKTIHACGCKYPYPDSPKTIFIVTGQGVSYSLESTQNMCATPSEEDEYVKRAKALKDKIYPLIPASIKEKFTGELGEWQASLLFAKEL